MELQPGYHWRHYRWYNTNYMLKRSKEGYNGVKTGITEAAGPCLSASYEKGEHHFIVVLLKSGSMDIRWEEVPQLVEWAIQR